MFLTVNLRRMKALPYIILLFFATTAIIVLGSRESEKAILDTVSLDTARCTLVIDAGHGGLDGGAVAPSGLTESRVNLDIAQRLEALCTLFGAQSVMTRTSEEIEYPPSAGTVSAKKAYETKMRVELANSIEHALLLSIHQNKFPDGSPRGAQALYGAGDESKAFGELLQENLTAGLYPENRRTAARIPDSIYLMKHVQCPAVLVECGFLSNPTEAALLETDTYKLKIAAVLIASFLKFTAGEGYGGYG